MIPKALDQSERSISQNMTIFGHEGTTVPEPLFYHYSRCSRRKVNSFTHKGITKGCERGKKAKEKKTKAFMLCRSMVLFIGFK